MSNTKKTAPKAVNDIAAEVTETVETVVKASTDAASKGVEKAVAMSQEQVAAVVKVGTDAFKSYEDAASFSKANVDAVMKANAVFVQGIQDFNKALFGIVETALEDNAAMTTKLMGCKNVQDAVAVQSDLAQAGYSKALDQSRKITDLTTKLVEETSAPIAKQVTITVEKFAKPLAA